MRLLTYVLALLLVPSVLAAASYRFDSGPLSFGATDASGVFQVYPCDAPPPALLSQSLDCSMGRFTGELEIDESIVSVRGTTFQFQAFLGDGSSAGVGVPIGYEVNGTRYDSSGVLPVSFRVGFLDLLSGVAPTRGNLGGSMSLEFDLRGEVIGASIDSGLQGGTNDWSASLTRFSWAANAFSSNATWTKLDPPIIPIPASLPMMIGGIAILGWMRTQRRN